MRTTKEQAERLEDMYAGLSTYEVVVLARDYLAALDVVEAFRLHWEGPGLLCDVGKALSAFDAEEEET